MNKSGKIEVSSFAQELDVEVSATFIDELKLIIGWLYHSLAGSSLTFPNCIGHFPDYISGWTNCNIIIGVDLNMNFDVLTNKING